VLLPLLLIHLLKVIGQVVLVAVLLPLLLVCWRQALQQLLQLQQLLSQGFDQSAPAHVLLAPVAGSTPRGASAVLLLLTASCRHHTGHQPHCCRHCCCCWTCCQWQPHQIQARMSVVNLHWFIKAKGYGLLLVLVALLFFLLQQRPGHARALLLCWAEGRYFTACTSSKQHPGPSAVGLANGPLFQK
jgi:hypothetical protein